ncbi:DUF3060 domain-containing protein [Massilia antarctica]|uniref:DUF3060 domain-containing protein n=1 Tax=Massilia antarctica TaxID=2765360 RepID=A0AA49A773_9BURK|nr:DUF3060 domain-containing protein [Massilia antarctica]QPI48305.1 DUF3060 domain-containing protein [Massilia antarctica]
MKRVDMSFRASFILGLAAMAAFGTAGVAMAEEDSVGAVASGKDKIQISGNGHQGSFPCEGRRAVIEGTDNVITFTGVCSALEVSGSGNSVTIQLAPKAPLTVEGVDNSVRWQSTAEPKKSISGVNNRVVKMAGRG